jgi:hypothetical protein
MPWHDDDYNPWSAWVSQHRRGYFAHPNSPLGGCGYGTFRSDYRDEHCYIWGVPHPSSPAAQTVTPQEAASGYLSFEFEKARYRVGDASSWDKLRRVAERALGPQSFGLGVSYGFVKNPVVSVAQLVQLQKMFIEADLYDQLTRQSPWWKRQLFGMVFGSPAAGLLIMATVKAGRMSPEDLKRAYEMREALIKEVGQIFVHPGEFFEKLKDEAKASYLDKWTRFIALHKQTDLKSQFEGGEIFGDVLMDLVMLILTLLSAVGAARQAAAQAAKIAAKFPQLIRVAEYIRGVRAAEAGAVAEEGAAAVETVNVAETLPKKEIKPTSPDAPIPKTPIVAELNEVESNGVKAIQIRQGTNGKVAVIGRDMKAVRPFAETLRAQGYEVEVFDPPLIPQSALDEWQALRAKYAPDYIPDSEVVTTSLYKANRQWAEKLVSEGYTVTDIGAAPGASLSPFYEMEKTTIF